MIGNYVQVEGKDLNRHSGRTTAIMLNAISLAIYHQGKNIHVTDHYNVMTEDRSKLLANAIKIIAEKIGLEKIDTYTTRSGEGRIVIVRSLFK